MLRIVTQYLRESAVKYPAHPALTDRWGILDYAQFLDAAEHIAAALCHRGLFKRPVAIMLEKSTAAVVSMFGTAMSGNYYTIIDEKMPQTRVERIFSVFEPALILTDRKHADKAPKDALVYEDLLEQVCTPEDSAAIAAAERRIIDTDLLYVLFTSGSTGMPKGVMITHRSVIDYTEWASESFQFSSETVLGSQAPFYFDNSVLDIYCAVRNGASLHIIPAMLYAFPIRLLEYIRDNQINTVFWVPTVLCRIANLNLLDKCDISCMQNVLFAGEVMPAKQLNQWMRRLPNAVFANLYGPTEITVDCTCYVVDRPIADDESVPIGYACENTDVLILNEHDQPATVDEKGELCVRGSSLSLGYYRNPEQTDTAFVQNPLNTLYAEKIYRTGDIVHRNARGEIIYDGRKDSQIKHTGHRIELGEIETAVSSHQQIAACCCLHMPERDELVLFYTGDTDAVSLKKHLAALVPDYMIPNIYHRLKQMPLNANGKIDRLALKKLVNEQTE